MIDSRQALARELGVGCGLIPAHACHRIIAFALGKIARFPGGRAGSPSAVQEELHGVAKGKLATILNEFVLPKARVGVVPASNFSAKGLAAASSYGGIGPFGTYDMAGNAKEWCLNATGEERYILGGAWDEPTYMFNDADAQPPLSRSDNFGFRLVK